MASGDTLIAWSALSHEPRSSGVPSPTFDVRNDHPVLDFGDDQVYSAVFSGIMPQHYGGGGVTISLHYAMSTGTTGTISLQTQFELTTNLDTSSFGPSQETGAVGVPGTAGLLSIETIQHSDGGEMGNVTAGSGFRFAVNRAVSSANGDLELRWVEIRET